MAAPTLTTGATFTFSSSFLAQPLSVNWSGIERTVIESTHFGTTGGRTFAFGSLYDPGTLTVRHKFDATLIMPITGAIETVTVNFPGAVDSWQCSGALQSFDFSGELEDHVEATSVIKLTGTISVVT